MELPLKRDIGSPQLPANKKVEKGARPHSSANPKVTPQPPVAPARQQRQNSAHKRVSL